MNFIEKGKENYFSFRGRLNRKAFWLRLVTVYVVMQVIGAAGAHLLAGMGHAAVVSYSLAVSFTFLLSQASLWVRRFHDRNVSGYWYGIVFMFQMLALLICIYAFSMKQDALMMMGLLLLGIAALLWLYVLVRFGFTRGTKGANDYGADPLEEQ